MTIGEKIKNNRKRIGMTQEELAKQVGYTGKSMISRIENGKNKPSYEALSKIARALDMSPADLLGDDASMLELSVVDNGLAKAYDRLREKDKSDIERIGLPMTRIPILGRISAGLPLFAEQNIEGYTLTTRNGGNEYFALRVVGDSMTAAGINPGNIIIVRRQNSVEDGEIAVVMVEDEDATVKHFHRAGTIVTLSPQSCNPKHLPQLYDLRKTRIRVLGKVVDNIISFE